MPKLLNKLDPKTFPIAMSACPFRAAAIEAEISGNEVPKATIVTPIKDSSTPKFIETLIALEISNSDEIRTINIPEIVKNKPTYVGGNLDFFKSFSTKLWSLFFSVL